MAQGKPYRYGLIAAGFCVVAVGLFIMIQEHPHIYGTMCALGVTLIFVGTAWSLCQCYPKVIVAPGTQEKNREDLVYAAADAKHERHAEAPPGFSGHKLNSSKLLFALPRSPSCHSCPALNLV